MKTRTLLQLSGKGVVRCVCGTIEDFCMDINEFIIPMLEDSITAEFNGKTVIVLPDDNADTLCDTFWKIL